jgi:hypothetical protein
MSYSLPKYYFQDIHPDVMDEIMHGMQEALPRTLMGGNCAIRFGIGNDLAPQIHRVSHHPLCNRTNLRIRDTETLFERLPQVTPWDVELLNGGRVCSSAILRKSRNVSRSA